MLTLRIRAAYELPAEDELLVCGNLDCGAIMELPWRTFEVDARHPTGRVVNVAVPLCALCCDIIDGLRMSDIRARVEA